MLQDAVLRQTEFGNAVNEHSADLMQRFEDGNVVAPFRKIARTRKAGWTGPDDGDLLALADLLYVGRFRAIAVFAAPVGREALEIADCDALALDSEDAAAFALGFLRAHSSAHGGQR